MTVPAHEVPHLVRVPDRRSCSCRCFCRTCRTVRDDRNVCACPECQCRGPQHPLPFTAARRIHLSRPGWAYDEGKYPRPSLCGRVRFWDDDVTSEPVTCNMCAGVAKSKFPEVMP